MKGVLSGMTLVAMRKRKLLSCVGSRKKSRKSAQVDGGPDKEIAFSAKGCMASLELVAEQQDVAMPSSTLAEHMVEAGKPIKSSITGSEASRSSIVSLGPNQMVAMDGWAIVSLLKGHAKVLGYNLPLGAKVILCSNSKLSATICIEAISRTKQMEGDTMVTNPGVLDAAPEFRSAGCVLEFLSYNPGDDTSTMPYKHKTKHSFRLELVEVGMGKPEKNLLEINDLVENDVVTPGTGEDIMKPDGQSIIANNEEETVDGEEQQEGKVSSLHLTFIPNSWKVAVTTISPQIGAASQSGVGTHEICGTSPATPIVAVCGAKNAGKSTFLRYLVNTLLNSHEAIGYLDTDVGQPEFTIPGCLSLHVLRKPIFGSPVLHLQSPERCFFYGDISPKSDPDMYVRSFVSLFEYFKTKYYNSKFDCQDNGLEAHAPIPLVINTNGWIKGVGYDVLVTMLQHSSPTHVVQFVDREGNRNKNLPPGKFWEATKGSTQVSMLHVASALDDPDSKLSGIKTASDHLRNLRVVAYFRQCFTEHPMPYPFRENKIVSEIAMGLVSCCPYQVPISEINIWHLHSQVPLRESLQTINSALVGLAVSSATLNEGVKPLPPVCVGFGIVRGVDTVKGFIYVITPLAVEVLQDVDTLLQGRVEIPVLLLQAKGYCSPYLCDNGLAIEGTGSGARRIYAGKNQNCK